MDASTLLTLWTSGGLALVLAAGFLYLGHRIMVVTLPRIQEEHDKALKQMTFDFREELNRSRSAALTTLERQRADALALLETHRVSAAESLAALARKMEELTLEVRALRSHH